jgi:carbamoyl-phosphate synthase small subunit
LLLEDGTKFIGKAFGKLNNKVFGEIVFNTGITGYQEILTDPSYAKQIVTLTNPEIGNYGTTPLDNQSRKVFATGLVIKNNSICQSSWRHEASLEDFMLAHNVSGISGIDTRALTKLIRFKGAMRTLISTEDSAFEDTSSLQQELLKQPSMKGQDLTGLVTVEHGYSCKAQMPSGQESKGKVVVLDFGLKLNMLTILTKLGYDLEVLPASSSYAQIMQHNPDGIFLSNGPGDPEACQEIIANVKELIHSSELPVFGVCLGHQILSLALGAKTYKLKFGHRGSNHPVKDLSNKKIMITSQNHGFAVDEKSLAGLDLKITHVSLNDGTVEGIEHLTKNVFSVQFHPEACPGPAETAYLFEKFAARIQQSKLLQSA